jgi:uncharacterized ParB-like nuclease family protein
MRQAARALCKASAVDQHSERGMFNLGRTRPSASRMECAHMPTADPKASRPIAAVPDHSIEDIPIDRIVVDPSRRALNPDVVADLVASIASVGLLEPIIVTPMADSQQFRLVAGRHRYEACKKLGHERIKSVRLDNIDEATSEEVEIVENLIRAELSPAERASHLLRLKQIYEARHPETRKGAQGGGRDGKGTRRRTGSAKLSFSKATAAKTGRSERSVEREVRRAKQLGEEDIRRVKGTSLDSPTEMDALIALLPEERARLIERAEKGEKVSAAARAAVIEKANKAALTSTARNGAGEPMATPVGDDAPRKEAVTVEHEDSAPEETVAAAEPRSILALVARAENAAGELLAALSKRGATGLLKALSKERRTNLATTFSVLSTKMG